MALTREQILAHRALLPKKTVQVPELGGDVTIRMFTLSEVKEIRKAINCAKDPLLVYPRIVATACVTEEGSQLFEGQDISLVDSFPFSATESIAKACLVFNKMIDSEDDDEGAAGSPKA